MRTIAILFVSSLLAAASEARAAEDLSKFDLAGVRIGMTKERAVAALAKHFGVPAAKIKSTQQKERDGSVWLTVAYQDGNTRCSAGFHVTDPKQPARVTSAMYVIPETPANRESMKSAAIQKYGKPSSTPGLNGYDLVWCADPESAESDTKSAANQLCLGDEKVDILLNHERIILSLNDVNRSRRAEQVRKDQLEKSKETKPRL